jgi:hypothetical protein
MDGQQRRLINMKSLIFGALAFLSIHYGWADALPPQDVTAIRSVLNASGPALSQAGTVTCNSCETDKPACAVYTPSQAYADVLSEPLKFVGRQAIPGQQNLICVYKNSKVFVVHEGCRPTPAQTLAVFFGTIISRTGGSVTTYIEASQRPYTLADASPSSGASWKLTSKSTPPFSGESWSDVYTAYDGATRDYSSPICYKTPTTEATSCRNNACDPNDDIAKSWSDPMSGNLKKVHDAILNAPRK